MARGAYTSTPSGMYGKAFLAKAWQARADLTEHERRGFAQFFYLTLCGHIEAVLGALIKSRLTFVRIAIRWESLAPMKYTRDGVEHMCSVQPIADSIVSVAESIAADSESAPLARLTEIYAKVFGTSIGALAGRELDRDLKALSALRNHFAHGRDLVMEFEVDEDWQHTGTLDGNPLRLPAQRLYEAGVIKHFNITGRNHHEFFDSFFSDEAMLHFYRAVRSAEHALKVRNTFLPEQSWVPQPPPLPELES